jgi:hypothetical protein
MNDRSHPVNKRSRETRAQAISAAVDELAELAASDTLVASPLLVKDNLWSCFLTVGTGAGFTTTWVPLGAIDPVTRLIDRAPLLTKRRARSVYSEVVAAARCRFTNVRAFADDLDAIRAIAGLWPCPKSHQQLAGALAEMAQREGRACLRST